MPSLNTYLYQHGIPFPMKTAIEGIGENAHLRRHWLKRIGAAFIDWLIATSIAWAFMYGTNCITPFNTVILTGIIWYLMAVVMEAKLGYTLGKYIFGFHVVSFWELMSLKKSLIRNLPKLLWFVWLPIDTIVGMILEGDPRQRLSDHVAETCVIIRKE